MRLWRLSESVTAARLIPADEIAFIHDAKMDAQRDALFKEMRTGKKKVLIGSTDKCGTGVNVQTHLVAMHHVDCPWKPSSPLNRGKDEASGRETKMKRLQSTDMSPKEPLMHTTGHSSKISGIYQHMYLSVNMI